MRRTAGWSVMAGALVMVACSPGKEVTQTTAAPNDTSSDQSLVPSSTSAGDTPPASSLPNATLPDGQRPPVALPGLLDPSDEPIPNDAEVRTGTLANGLQYYVRHNERPGGKAELRLAIRAGSVNETGESTGVAHFVEHMLFNGTEQFPENELIDVLRGFGAAFGADINAYTAFDETVYELSVPSDEQSVSTGMTVLTEWLSHATFDPDQVEAERGIVLDEWRQSTQSVGGRLFDVAQGVYLAGSAYEGRDPIGSNESISAVPRDELYAYYQQWYRPDNAAVVVVGDIDVDVMVSDIEQRFGSATAATDAAARPDTTFAPETEPAFALHSDPDQPTVDVEVDLPLPAYEGSGTAALRAQLIDTMIFDALVRRLDEDITAGTAPFDEITPGTNSFVTSLDAPALYAVTDAERVGDTLQALLDEYERANRFGFTPNETEIVKATAQAGFDSQFEGRSTTQDVDFAEQYVANYLYAQPYPSIDDLYGVASQIIESITPEALDLRFRARWDNTAPHVIISTPASDEAAMPNEADVLAAIAGVADRQIEPRQGGRELPDTLVATPPLPVDPTTDQQLTDNGDEFFDPIELVFPNGARVLATSNDIVDGQVGVLASSLGGSSLIADDDAVDALYAADVVTTSGVGEFDQTELETILADRDVQLGAWLTPYTENFAGSAGSSDLEILFQQIYLYMTAPRFDPVALTQLQRSYQPVVDDPGSDPDAAGYDALIDARYGDELRYATLPTPEQFATLDLGGVERVWRDRFGDASDWVFAFAGDIDLDELRRLASTYIGQLPGVRPAEQFVDLATPAPPGVVKSSVQAGTGDTATSTLLFTSPVPDIDASLRATSDVVTEVITSRLTDVIREQLGESYSPFATSYITTDPGPTIETYVQVTGAPDRVESVADLVVAELADLAANGPSEHEFENANAQIEERYQFVDNQTFLQEMVDPFLWPQRGLDDYFEEFQALAGVDAADVQQYIATNIPADHYIQVATLPRA